MMTTILPSKTPTKMAMNLAKERLSSFVHWPASTQRLARLMQTVCCMNKVIGVPQSSHTPVELYKWSSWGPAP